MKNIKVLALLLSACLCFTACGNKQETPSTDAAQTQSSAETAGDVQSSKEAEFAFVYEGIEIRVGHLMSEYLEALGEPMSYFEAASCAFDGLDKVYTYNDFEITTYPVEDKDYVGSILFKSDMVETKEGVALFATKADMIAAYGENFVDENGVLIYYFDGNEKNGRLCFILSGDEVVSIEYQAPAFE
jgi:hypothetical protein